jgi:hypothetical protein
MYVGNKAILGDAWSAPVQYPLYFFLAIGLCATRKNFAKKDFEEKTRKKRERRRSVIND